MDVFFLFSIWRNVARSHHFRHYDFVGSVENRRDT